MVYFPLAETPIGMTEIPQYTKMGHRVEFELRHGVGLWEVIKGGVVRAYEKCPESVRIIINTLEFARKLIGH